jgi:hypothetical protein
LVHTSRLHDFEVVLIIHAGELLLLLDVELRSLVTILALVIAMWVLHTGKRSCHNTFQLLIVRRFLFGTR